MVYLFKIASMKLKITLLIVLALLGLASCESTNKILSDTNAILNGGSGSNPLSNDEVISGLKEALRVGTNNSTGKASQLDGYLKNPALFIPFPPEAQKVKTKLTDLGFANKISEFETSLNRAAEEAAKDAAPIFIDAVTSMTITDGFTILRGADTAATHYLREKTYAALVEKFKPTVKNAIEKVNVTKYWNPLITTYNKIPFVEKQNPDLDSYVTHLAAQGLFKLVRDEEMKIRRDPVARVNDILKRVFGNAGN
jgi:hypothetical protein